MTEPIRVLIIDDNPIVRLGLRNLLDVHSLITVVGEADNGDDGVRMSRELAPDVVLCDVRMPGLDGVGAAAQMAPFTHVVMLTYTEDLETIRSTIAAGAKGYLVHGAHQPDEIVAAVITAASGSSVLGPAASKALLSGPAVAAPGVDHSIWGLTAREGEIMDLLAKGLNNRAIAKTCFLAEKTVKNHINNIFPKLGVSNRAEAMSLWLGARETQMGT